MNPAARLSVALLAGLLLWLPTLSATLRGEVDLLSAAVRYLVGFVLARVAVGLLVRLVDGYRSAPPVAADGPAAPAAPAPPAAPAADTTERRASAA